MREGACRALRPTGALFANVPSNSAGRLRNSAGVFESFVPGVVLGAFPSKPPLGFNVPIAGNFPGTGSKLGRVGW